MRPNRTRCCMEVGRLGSATSMIACGETDYKRETAQSRVGKPLTPCGETPLTPNNPHRLAVLKTWTEWIHRTREM